MNAYRKIHQGHKQQTVQRFMSLLNNDGDSRKKERKKENAIGHTYP